MIVEPLWEKENLASNVDPASCHQGTHTWVAQFYTTGALAFWECDFCCLKDRVIGRLHEPLEGINGWIKAPLRLVARSCRPPNSTRQWKTQDSSILYEGEPSSIHFGGLGIPGLVEAHAYLLKDAEGNIKQEYIPLRERLGKYNDHYWLTRYQVIGTILVQFISHCFEESTYDTPFANQPKQQILLSDLQLLPG